MAPCVEPGLRPQRRSEDATGSSALIANGFEVLGWGTFLDSISSYKGSHLGEGCLKNANAVVRPQDVAQRAPPVGTDLRAVRRRRRGAFGEIALPGGALPGESPWRVFSLMGPPTIPQAFSPTPQQLERVRAPKG